MPMKSADIQIRDPFILTDKTKSSYYLYGTTDKNPWNSAGTGFDAYHSPDLENWNGPHRVFSPDKGFPGTHDFWAPEVHYYNDAYYMFATFAGKNRKRGTYILKSADPLGPFIPVSDSPATPSDWQCLDGTLFVDRDGQPWMIFCREWVEINDGEICAVRLRSDLGGAVGEAQVLFHASEAAWPSPVMRRDGSGMLDAYVTDGPFLHSCANGSLVMIWSSLSGGKYALGFALSRSGSVSGPWEQTPGPLLDSGGGHGMIFRTLNGELKITYHFPNDTPLERFYYSAVTELEDGLSLS